MTKKSFKELVLQSNSIPWNNNWANDRQPTYLQTTQYLDIARKLRVEALQKVKDFLQKVPNGVIKDDVTENPGYYTLEPCDYHGIKTKSIDTLIEELTTNKNDNRFLKGNESVQRKLKEYQAHGIDHPEKIGDYLRMQILFDNAQDLVLARHSLQFGNDLTITSQKDKLRRPDQICGHRSFMAHAEVQDEGSSLKFEIMLALYQAETFMADKTFRNSERTSYELGTKYAAEKGSLSTAYFAASSALAELRKISFYNLYAEIEGVNDLLDTDIDVNGICKHAEYVAEFNAVSASYILGKLPTVNKLFPDLLVEPRHH